MRTTIADTAAFICWSAAGIGFVWAGLFFMASYSPHLAPDAQLFYLLGVLLGLAGSGICCWLLIGLMCALLASSLETRGKRTAARRLKHFVPRFLQRLAGGTIALCLISTPSFAIDLSFEDTANDDTSVSKLAETNGQDHDEDPTAGQEVPMPDSSLIPSPVPVEESAAPQLETVHEPAETLRAETPGPETSGPVDLRLRPSLPKRSEPRPTVQPSPQQPKKQPKQSVPPAKPTPSEKSRKANPPVPSPLPGQERRQLQNRTVVVLRGDSLWSIARAELGPTATNAQVQLRTQEWYQENRSAIGADPHLIHPGTILTAPTVKDH